MGATVGDWIDVLNRLYPPDLAEEWDNSGLQVGDRSWPVDRLLLALDPASAVIDEARERGCGLLVAHHPLIFRPLHHVDLAEASGRAVAAAVGGRVAVFACHTNADASYPSGVTDALAGVLGIEITGVLRHTEAGARVKLVTFVPPEATEKVLDAVAQAGAGVIGEYTHCSFRVRGSGTFLPSERAHPAIGERGQLNQVEEDRLEVVVPRARVAAAVQAMIQAHPYEEAAYDTYPLAGGGLGLGRVGRMPQPVRARELADLCRDRLGSSVRVAGDPEREVRRVALCGGSGASLIDDAIRAGVDAYLTGDVKHHAALEAVSSGLVVVDAGHHGTEWPFVPALAGLLRDAGTDLGGEVLVSSVRTDPFTGR